MLTHTNTDTHIQRGKTANLHPQVGMCFLSFFFNYLFISLFIFLCAGFLLLCGLSPVVAKVPHAMWWGQGKKVSMAYLNNPQFISCIYERCPLLWTLPYGSHAVLSHFSHVPLFAILWTVARQAPMSTGFSRQEYWSGLPFPPPEDLFNSGIEPGSPALQADSLPLAPPVKPLPCG